MNENPFERLINSSRLDPARVRRFDNDYAAGKTKASF
jgi:hypothetical protein